MERPDIELIQAGWQRSMRSDQYSWDGETWLSHDAARAIQFPEPEKPAKAADSMIDLLKDIRDTLHRIEQELSRNGGVAT
jgi:hypothetical protein